MSLAANLVLKDFDGAFALGEDREYDLITTDPSGSSRLLSTSTLVNPETLVIKHTMASAKTKGVKVDRHLMSLSVTEPIAGSTDGSTYTTVLNLTIAKPRGSSIDTAQYTSILCYLMQGYGTDIERGES